MNREEEELHAIRLLSAVQWLIRERDKLPVESAPVVLEADDVVEEESQAENQAGEIDNTDVEELIDLIPSIRAEAYHGPTLQALSQHYQSAVRTHDCRDLLELMMSIYAKRQQAEAQKRRLGMVDERFMKQAERMLYGEFSVALGIPFEAVQPYIAQRIEGIAPAQV